mmetsp:Transcript_88541/g.177022  ORF Transcript_88541/g.177022 Transcript_88541/m.177022 type:complete len:474 (-) Transcript_88541:128-1549(-)
MAQSAVREKQNWWIHSLYVRHEHDECLAIINKQLKDTAFAEYPIYVKGLIYRKRGRIQESLTLFQSATCLNPNNTANLKQVGHSLFLLGMHKQAIEVYEEARKIGNEARTRERLGGSSVTTAMVEDWEILHNKGLCLGFLPGRDQQAIESFRSANEASPHDITFRELGRALERSGDLEGAKQSYRDALLFSPENAEALSSFGLLTLRLGDSRGALQLLTQALSVNPRHPKALLAWGSITQDSGRYYAAILKYRIAAAHTPASAQLWNNVGMCFLGKGQLVPSLGCLKRALYLSPMEWIISYNLGLVHLKAEQNASAFQHFAACVSLNPEFGAACMLLGVTLAKLGDLPNACKAYERALSLEPSDHVIRLNFAITLFNAGEAKKEAAAALSAADATSADGGDAKVSDGDAKAEATAAHELVPQANPNISSVKEHMFQFDQLIQKMGKDVEHDDDVLSQAEALREAIVASSVGAP